MKKSFSEVVEQEPERLVAYAFERNPHIKDFSDFDNAFREVFNTPLGENAKIDSDDIIKLFDSQPCKQRIKQNIDSKEYEKLFGDGVIVQRLPLTKTKVTTITYERIKVKSYANKRGVHFKPYSKGYKKWNDKEINFLKIQKQKKISPNKIFTNYNTRFKENPRTKSSITTKIFRTR